jgi:hypothetical protein
MPGMSSDRASLHFSLLIISPAPMLAAYGFTACWTLMHISMGFEIGPS